MALIRLTYLLFVGYFLILGSIPLSFAQNAFSQDSIEYLLDQAKSKRSTDPAIALEYAQKARTAAQQQELFLLEGEALRILTRLFVERGEYDRAVQTANEGLILFQDLGDSKGEVRMYIALGIIYRLLNQYDQSIAYYQQAEQIAEAQDMEQVLASIYGNMGNVYYNMSEYDLALSSHLKSLEIDEKKGNEQGMGNTYNNIANIFFTQERYEAALTHYRKSLLIDQKLGNKSSIALSYLNLTRVYLELGDNAQAWSYAQQALNTADTVQNIRLSRNILSYLPLCRAC